MVKQYKLQLTKKELNIIIDSLEYQNHYFGEFVVSYIEPHKKLINKLKNYIGVQIT